MTHVLVVDDDPAIRTMLAEALGAEGYAVRLSADGFSALNLVRTDPPDLVILDLKLPVLDGQEFVDAWRTAVPSSNVPILVLTASPELPGSLTGLGIQGHITKPFDVEAVVAAVGNLTRA
jgi:DNA-binding response OmpR family regulator